VTCPTDGSGLDPFIQTLLDSGDYTMFVATDSPSEMAFDTCYNCYYAPVIPIDELTTLEPGEPVTSDNMVEYIDGLPDGFDLEMCGDASTISPTGGPRIPQRASASYGFNLQVGSGGPGGGMGKVGISSACHGTQGSVYIDIFSNDANEAPMCEFSGESRDINRSGFSIDHNATCTRHCILRLDSFSCLDFLCTPFLSHPSSLCMSCNLPSFLLF
jgi:hypothetical protein